jgi:hypothetical protein
VDHPVRVGVGHRLADGFEDPQETRQVRRRVGAVGQQIAQGAPLDQLHREERPLIGQGPTVINGSDPRMLELATDSGFLDEPLDKLRVAGMLGQ